MNFAGGGASFAVASATSSLDGFESTLNPMGRVVMCCLFLACIVTSQFEGLSTDVKPRAKIPVWKSQPALRFTVNGTAWR